MFINVFICYFPHHNIKKKMKNYDLGISFVNSKDKTFINILKKNLKKSKKTSFIIDYNNIVEVIKDIDNKKIHFKSFLDLASFENSSFAILIEKLENNGTNVINNPKSILNSFNKTNLHNLLLKNNLPVRKCFIINPKKYNKQDLDKIPKSLGTPFVLINAVTAYEDAIVLNAKHSEDIKNFLENYPTENCLAYEYVTPSLAEDKVAWFRVIYSCGKIIPHWWDPQNKFYQKFGNSKKETQIRSKIEKDMLKIAELTGLKLFSTEFVIKQNNKFVIIDYANAPIDLSSQELENDGVVEGTLEEITKSIVDNLSKK